MLIRHKLHYIFVIFIDRETEYIIGDVKMKAIELMDILAKAVNKNSRVDVSFMINEETVKDFNLGTMEGTNFFDIGMDTVPEEDVAFIFLKKGIDT